jgi:tRNA threonylcarbamoyladenosine biosynthesis protein TsaB
MTVLGIEAATSVCGAALVRNGAVIGESSLVAPQLHSEKLLSLVDGLLRSAGMPVKELGGIACSAGPGSFTGLRIGLSVAKGLAYAAELPLAAVPTLEALALRSVRDGRLASGGRVLAALDARRDEVYAALYHWNGAVLGPVIPTSAVTVQTLLLQLERFAGERLVLTGDGSAKLVRGAAGRADDMFAAPEPGQELCSAAAVAILGEERLRAGAWADLESLEPEYGKEFYTTATPLPQQG